MRTKRKQAWGTYSTSRKRARTSSYGVNKTRRTRSQYYRRRNVRRSFGNRKYLKKYNFRKPTFGKEITKHIHIPCTIKSSNFVKKLYRAGQKHYLHWFIGGATSTVSGNNPLSFRLHASLGQSMFAYGGWTGTASTPSGTINDANLPYPQVTRYLLVGIQVKFVIYQINENMRMRICLASMARPGSGIYNTTRLFGWNNVIDEPQNEQFWKIHWQRNIKFDDPTALTPAGGTEYKNNRVREVSTYLPFNRVMETSTRATATGDGSWEPTGSDWYHYTYFIINSDDQGSLDGEYAQVNCFVSSLWYELE